jgi:hypothetical protein
MVEAPRIFDNQAAHQSGKVVRPEHQPPLPPHPPPSVTGEIPATYLEAEPTPEP